MWVSSNYASHSFQLLYIVIKMGKRINVEGTCQLFVIFFFLQRKIYDVIHIERYQKSPWSLLNCAFLWRKQRSLWVYLPLFCNYSCIFSPLLFFFFFFSSTVLFTWFAHSGFLAWQNFTIPHWFSRDFVPFIPVPYLLPKIQCICGFEQVIPHKLWVAICSVEGREALWKSLQLLLENYLNFH